MKKIYEIQKICMLYYGVYVYRYVFKNFFFNDFCVQLVIRRNQNVLLIKFLVFNVNNGINNTRELILVFNNVSRELVVG